MIHRILFTLLAGASLAAAQTTTLTINNSSGDVNVPAGLTANFPGLKINGTTVTLPSGDLLGTGGSYANPGWLTSLGWSKLTGTPTSLSGYGIIDPVVLTSSSYANPAWITSLAGSKLTGTVIATNGVVTTGTYANPSWVTSLAWSKLTGTPTSLSGYGIADPIVLTSGNYPDPAWITSLAGSKLTGTVIATNGVVTTGTYANPSWLTSLAWSKLTGTPTTLTAYGITDAARPVHAVAVPARVNLPTTGSLRVFGDSQTYGTNASGASYTTSGRLNEAYRWPNILATTDGRSLTVTNYAVPGSKITTVPAFSGGTWHEMGQLPYDWVGVCGLMAGWNNTDANTTTPAFYDRVEHAYRAFAARFLIDDYAGLGVSGWGHTGSSGGTLHGFTTTGDANSIAVPPGENNRAHAFYYGAPSGDKLRIALESGETIQFTLSDKRACALFFESNTSGGSYTVTLNGVKVADGNTQHTNLGGNDQNGHQWPQAVWLDDLPASATVTITATSSTVYFAAYGWVERTESRLADKRVLIGPMPANTHEGRTEAMLAECNRRGLAVMREFSTYPIYFAGVYDAWISERDRELADPPHLTPAGNSAIAAAFARASKPPHAAVAATPSSRKFEDLTGFRKNRVTIPFGGGDWPTPTTVGSGSVVSQGLRWMRLWANSTTGSSVLIRNTTNTLFPIMSAGQITTTSGIPWSGRIRCKIRFGIQNADANTVQRFKLGDTNTSTTVGDLTVKGIGFKITNLDLKAMVHNGTTLTVSSTLATLAAGALNEVILDADGAGNLQIWLNGQALAPVTGAPTSTGSNGDQCVSFSTANGAGTAFAVLDLNGEVEIIVGGS